MRIGKIPTFGVGRSYRITFSPIFQDIFSRNFINIYFPFFVQTLEFEAVQICCHLLNLQALEIQLLDQNGRKKPVTSPKFRNFTEAKIVGRLRIPIFGNKIGKIWKSQKCARNKNWKLR